MPRGKKRNYRRKKKYSPAVEKAYKEVQALRRNRKPFLVYPKVNEPLMPKTKLVKMKYVTRIQIDPAAVASSQTLDSSAANIKLHTFVFNCIHDPDYTSTITNSPQHDLDGARDHQPRMHDQYSGFYNYNTVVSAKLRADFITREHVQNFDTAHTGTTNVVTSVPCVKQPEPCIVGFLDNEFERNHTVSVRLDDILEKNQCKYKKTTQRPRTYTMTKYWSLRKDPMYKAELTQASGQGSDVSWGSTFSLGAAGGVTGSTNARYCHLFAHPLTTKDNIDPEPIDVFVSLEQIVLLSDLKDIAQSS